MQHHTLLPAALGTALLAVVAPEMQSPPPGLQAPASARPPSLSNSVFSKLQDPQLSYQSFKLLNYLFSTVFQTYKVPIEVQNAFYSCECLSVFISYSVRGE